MKTSKKRSNSESKINVEPIMQEAVLEPVIQIPAVQTEEKMTQVVSTIKKPNRLLLIVLLLGWIFDLLFWKQKVGVNFALFLTICLLGGLYLLFAEGYKPARTSLWLLLPFLFFTVISFVRRESLTISLAYTFALFSIGLLATSYQGGRWYLYQLSDYLYKFISLIGDLLAGPIGFFRKLRKTSSESVDSGKSLLIPGLMRGLAIAVPIVLFFGSLLASADMVFNQKIADFFDAHKISEYIQQLILILISAYLLSGV